MARRNSEFSQLASAVHKLTTNDLPHMTKRLDSLDHRLVRIDTHLSWIIKIMMLILASGGAVVVGLVMDYL